MSVQIQSFRYMRLPTANTKHHPSRHINITPNLCTTYRRTNAVSNNYQHVVPYCQSGTKSWYFISGRIWTQGTLERSSQGQTGPHEQDGLNRSVWCYCSFASCCSWPQPGPSSESFAATRNSFKWGTIMEAYSMFSSTKRHTLHCWWTLACSQQT